MRTRDLSVRTKILALLLAPFLALVALWIVATAATLDTARSLTAAQTYRDDARTPAERLIDQLQQERKLSIVYLGDRRADAKPLKDQRTRTDAALAGYRRKAESGELTSAADEVTKQRLRRWRRCRPPGRPSTTASWTGPARCACTPGWSTRPTACSPR
jgi:hypothetical protein